MRIVFMGTPDFAVPSLDALCDDLGVDKQEIVQKLEAEEYSYDPERNQFI